jgi:hypothetical protein
MNVHLIGTRPRALVPVSRETRQDGFFIRNDEEEGGQFYLLSLPMRNCTLREARLFHDQSGS